MYRTTVLIAVHVDLETSDIGVHKQCVDAVQAVFEHGTPIEAILEALPVFEEDQIASIEFVGTLRTIPICEEGGA